MFVQAPIEIEAPLNRIYIFTRWYRGDDPFGENRLAFPPDRAFAMERLRRLANDSGGDPFNYRLYDVWQMVYQKPWTRPRNVDDLIRDLAEKIHRGELFVYERSAARHYTLISELHAEDAVAVRAVRPPMLVVSNEGRHQDTEDTFEYDLMSQQLAAVKSEGWLGAHNPSGSLEIRLEGTENATPGQNGPHESLHLWMSREVRGEYSRIPLHLMRELAVRHGVPMREITEEERDDMIIPDELSEIAAVIEAHVLGGAPLELTDEQSAWLKQRYIHHSDHYEPLGPLYPHKPAPGHQRAIYNKQGL